MNKFGDMTREEFNRFYKGFNATKNMHKLQNDRVYQRPLGFKIPDAIDWRKLGAVTPIQTQQQCASDWAFSSTASLEGQHFRATG
jgi:cathepsin L